MVDMKHSLNADNEDLSMANGLNIVLINGWSMPAGIWDDFFQHLTALVSIRRYQVVSVDQTLTADQWLEYLDEVIEPNTLLLGWSLGGMLAMNYACLHSEKIVAVCTFQMNPKFVASTDWPCAMDVATFQAFKQLASADAAKLVKQFGFLITTQGQEALSDLKRLKLSYTVDTLPSTTVLLSTLELLETLDVRAAITQLHKPQLHIYGEQDQLVPKAVAEQGVFHCADGGVEVVAGVSHFPGYGAASVLAEKIGKFVGGLD